MLHVKLKNCWTPHIVRRYFLDSCPEFHIKPAEMPDRTYIIPHATGKAQFGGVRAGLLR